MQQGRKESGQEGGFLAILEVSPMPSHWVGMRNTVHTPSSSSRSVHFKLVSRMTFMFWVYPPKEAWCKAVQPLWSLWKSEDKTVHSLHRWIVGRDAAHWKGELDSNNNKMPVWVLATKYYMFLTNELISSLMAFNRLPRRWFTHIF